MTFEQDKAGYIKAKDSEGADIWFRPVNLTVRDVPGGGVELSFAGPFTLTMQGSSAEYLEFLEPTPDENTPDDTAPDDAGQ